MFCDIHKIKKVHIFNGMTSLFDFNKKSQGDVRAEIIESVEYVEKFYKFE